MRIGIVCPYSLDVPGGVQNQIRDLAEELIARGHAVSVLAPTEETDGLPEYVVPAGRAVPVPYNGAVGHVLFGPIANARVRRWLADGGFDVVHLHEPGTPSLSLLALGSAKMPVVATFHITSPHSRFMTAAAGLLRPRLERIDARIAVSEYARDTLVQHHGGEPVIIPNGLYVDRFRNAQVRPEWQGDQTVVFVGRLDEARKGLPVLLEAFAGLAAERAGLRLLVVGGGDVEQARELLPEEVRPQVSFLGPVSDSDKVSALASADVYVAPNTGLESFGIVLIEAMAAGTAVLASDIGAFQRVLEYGSLGDSFRNGDSADLRIRLAALLDDPERRAELVAAASRQVMRYDWSRVATQVERVYETVVGR
ncbi:MAG: glycosyltransferase family 4 protein [Actinomycetota bacterium]|nr:glycosyltransferase family 4 protein [Actinomycetota bacterium]